MLGSIGLQGIVIYQGGAGIKREKNSKSQGPSPVHKEVKMTGDKILIRRGLQITTIPRKEWEQEIANVPQHFKTKLSFMTADHHRVRNVVVRELPVAGEPLSIEFIARQVDLSASRVTEILDDLEKHLTFLYRNPQGMVAWAYPVTVDQTPHHLTFSTGECLYAA